eukprot:m.66477 g.66477  ORF g.66477 m.66477 type:complete len:452 (-) comp15949_c0_seq1:99-1454(-)
MGDEYVADDSGVIRKQEEDYTEQVDAALPAAVAKATGGDLTGAIEGLLPLEKKARIASDSKSTSRILEGIIQMCFDVQNWDAMCENLLLLSKRRGALKMAITKMVQKGCECLEKAPSKEITLKVIDTLRTVTAGKIHVEVERARLTMKLSKIKEADGDIADAADVLQELQVETFGTMERREKVEFILEQMRLGLARKDFIRTAILSKKISTRYFKDESAQDLKLRFYQLNIQVALHEAAYLDVCKYNREIFDTPSVQADEEQWKPALRDVIVFLVLSPYDNEQADLVARVAQESKIDQIPAFKKLLHKFITKEIMPWQSVEKEFGDDLTQLAHFDKNSDGGKKRYEDFRGRVVEHNIRTMANYYTRISSKRLAALLELPEEQTEEFLSTLVVKHTVVAKINRPAGVVTFRQKQDAAAILEEWSASTTALMRQVDHAAHVIEKEQMALKVNN